MSPNQLRFRAPSHKDFSTTNSSGFTLDRVWVSRQSVAIFFFSFLFAFSFALLLFWKTHWPLCMGVCNLIKGVNDTRKGFAS